MSHAELRPGEIGPPGEEIPRGTRLVIVRHGEARCNVAQIIGGPIGCTGLTETGVLQVERLAERVLRTGELDGPAAFWASPLPRASESAVILADALGISSVDTCECLREQDPGEADGLTWTDYVARYRQDTAPGSDPDLLLAPGGESWNGFVARAKEALLTLAATSGGGLVVVVAHGGVIDSSMVSFLSIPDYGVRVRLHPDPTSLTEWRYSGVRWRLVRYNDASHLGEPEARGLRSASPPWLDE